MTNERKKVLELFRKFLKKHNAIEDFVKQNTIGRCYYIKNCTQFIVNSFTWNTRKDGELSWNELDDLWIKELKQKGIEC